jgi:hypothetical protein
MIPALAFALVTVETVSGATAALGSSSYADVYDHSYKLGLRVSAEVWRAGDWSLGPDAALDGQILDSHIWDKMYRGRALLGGRVTYQVRPRLQVYTRVLAGFDWLWTDDIRVQAPGEPSELGSLHQRHRGAALEVGFGAHLAFGRHFVLGAQLGVPVAFHNRDFQARGVVLSGGVQSPVAESAVGRVLIDDTLVELDALVTLGASF